MIGYSNHLMSPDVWAQKSKIQSDRFHQMFREEETLKALGKIPDIFFSAPVSSLNSTLYTGRTVYCF